MRWIPWVSVKSAYWFPHVVMDYFVWVLAWIHICMFMAVLIFAYVWHRSILYVWYLCPNLSLLRMDLCCILVAMTFLYLTWICVVLVDSQVVSHLGHVSKCAAESWWCFRSFDLWTFASTLNLVLSKYLDYCFPLAIIVWGAYLLYQNLFTLMLWDRYSLVCSNPSYFP